MTSASSDAPPETEFTGERFLPGMKGEIAYEHLHRYAFAARLTTGLTVLDVACGEGYGSALLSRESETVFGIDLDGPTIARARGKYGDVANLSFLEGTAEALPFDDASFDMIVSFETIEHLSDPDVFLSECARVLRDGGRLLISTPNRPVYGGLNSEPNSFHVHEYDRAEFEEALLRRFPHVSLVGQRFHLVSVLGQLDDEAAIEYGPLLIGRDQRGSFPLREPTYFLALCSKGGGDPSRLSGSLFVDPDDDLFLDHRRKLIWASSVHGEFETFREAAQQTAERAERGLAESARELQASRSDVGHLATRVQELEAVARTVADEAAAERENAALVLAQRARELQASRSEVERLATRVQELEAVARTMAVEAAAERENATRRLVAVRAANAAIRRERDDARDWSAGEAQSSVEEALGYADEVARAYSRRLYVLEQRSIALDTVKHARHLDRGTIAPKADLPLPRQLQATSWRSLHDADRSMIRTELREWALFEPEWYRTTYPETRSLDDEAALDHFVDQGLSRGWDPHPLFSTAWALAHGGSAAGRPPLAEHLLGGVRHPCHPLFDEEEYGRRNPDVEGAGLRLLDHYVKYGWTERRRPHPLFDPDWISRQRPDASEHLSLATYLEDPSAFDISPHPLFDPAHYRRQANLSPDVNPLLHYVLRGEPEGLSPHPLFEPAYYRRRYSEVTRDPRGALSHYVRQGALNRWTPHPLFDAEHYADEAPDAQVGLEHYVAHGASEGRAARPDLPAAALLDAVREEAVSGGALAALVSRRYLSYAVVLPPSIARPPAPPWLPAQNQPAMSDRLRSYLADRFGETCVASVNSCLSTVAKFGERPSLFEESAELWDLTARIAAAAGEEQATPDVSVIVPVHNALVFTLTCLVSLLETPARSRYEILVADDASSDDTPRVLSRVGGRVRLLRRDENLGFLRNCNAAACEARGRHLVFLNNDTLPLPGWLDALVDLAGATSKVGLVGSKLLNGDGSLQEAGGVIWRDGSGWNFGRGQDPDASPYNYVKDVDYCSGASILIPRSVWDELGGFDDTFAPAYCEDSDFAFRAREAGYRTIYQPSSEIIHHEGKSHGTDLEAGVKGFQVVNGRKFLDRWGSELRRHHFDNGTNLEVARDRSRGKPRILIVDHYIPQWDRDAGSRTMHHFIKLFLKKGFHVTFWPDNLHNDRRYAQDLQQLGVEIIYGPAYVGQFDRWVSERADRLDYALLSRPHIAENYIEALRDHSDAVVLYYGHDLHWQRKLLEYELTGDLIARDESMRWRAVESRMADLSHVVMYPSESERAIVAETIKADRVVAVPAWQFSADQLSAARARIDRTRMPAAGRLLFVGGFAHPPNVDAISWFVENAWPIVAARYSSASLAIVGSHPPFDIARLACDTVEVTGQVSDEELALHYANADVAIVPLRVGGGVKGKVIEAFSKAVPVVTTSVGLQGIPDGERMAFRADTSDAFAAAVIVALDDRVLAAEKASHAIEFLARDYSAARMVAILAPFVPELASGRSFGAPA